jgi:serine/threonine-protein kinase
VNHPVRYRFMPGCWVICALAAVSLTACGGGGSGSSGGGSANFTIGGTISGLNASGLILTDNGADNLAVSSGATTFTFSQTVMAGGNYSVAVATQPTGETCTVASGSGMANANVTNVAVSCTTNTYTIGGTISGLNESGLVLQNNGGDGLTVNSGSTTFTFSAPIAYGATYDVTVSSQPTGATCSVGSGTGTATSNVTNVSVTCTANTFTITGSASGLTAAGLKLQFYTGGQPLSVIPVASGSASFTYSSVPYGTNIAMTVAAQPGWEKCTVNGGDFTGTVTGNVTGENLTCVADTPTSSPVALAGGATLSGPDGIAVDASGNMFVADTTNSEILEISSSGTVTQIATGASPAFKSPVGIALDAHGDLFVADTGNNLIREIVATGGLVSPSSSVITLASSATFNGPQGVAVDASGNVYVADTLDNDIREIEATNGTVSATSTVAVLAGGASTGCVDGTGTAAQFDAPDGIALGPSGNLYVADTNNNVIRKITSVGPTGSNTVTVWAGSAATCDSASPATRGYVDGAATTTALFWHPTGVTVDSAGNLFVTDQYNDAVREVTPAGVVSTIAGATPPSGGTTTIYAFNLPFGIAVDSSDTLYVSDTGNNQIVTLVP